MGINEILRIGDKIKKYRQDLELTQEELAQKSGLSRNAIYNYENNKRSPTLEVLNEIAKALNVSIEELTGYSEARKIDNETKITINTKLIKDIRETAKMSIKQLADYTNLSASYLYQVERGDKEPSLSALNKIAEALNVNVKRLIGYNENAHEIDLSLIPTSKLIEELNTRKDFPIRLEIKTEE